MTNDQMKSGRFYRFAIARKKLAFINGAFNRGKNIQIVTQIKATNYQAKHAAMFKATKSGLFVQHGKGWNCIDYCQIFAV